MANEEAEKHRLEWLKEVEMKQFYLYSVRQTMSMPIKYCHGSDPISPSMVSTTDVSLITGDIIIIEETIEKNITIYVHITPSMLNLADGDNLQGNYAVVNGLNASYILQNPALFLPIVKY